MGVASLARVSVSPSVERTGGRGLAACGDTGRRLGSVHLRNCTPGSSAPSGGCGAGTLELLVLTPEAHHQFPHLSNGDPSLPITRETLWAAGGKGRDLTLPGLPHSLPQFPRPEGTARAPARPPRLTWSPRRRRRLGSSIAESPCMRPRPRARPSPPGPPPNTIGSFGQLTPGWLRPSGPERFATSRNVLQQLPRDSKT